MNMQILGRGNVHRHFLFCANIARTVGDAGPYKNIAPLDNVFYCCAFSGDSRIALWRGVKKFCLKITVCRINIAQRRKKIPYKKSKKKIAEMLEKREILAIFFILYIIVYKLYIVTKMYF